jgi:hypothetical protein
MALPRELMLDLIINATQQLHGVMVCPVCRGAEEIFYSYGDEGYYAPCEACNALGGVVA